MAVKVITDSACDLDQAVCDELDIAYENTSCVMGSTDRTVDQGGSGGSDALQTDGYPMRRVAAEARRGRDVLGTSDQWLLAGAADLEMADPRLNEDVLRRVSRAQDVVAPHRAQRDHAGQRHRLAQQAGTMGRGIRKVFHLHAASLADSCRSPETKGCRSSPWKVHQAFVNVWGR